MLRWTGVLDRTAYVARAGIAIAAFVAAAPVALLLLALMKTYECPKPWCGLVEFGWPFVTAPALAMILSICIRRARDAGLPPSFGAFPPIMMLGKQYFLISIAAGRFDDIAFNSVSLPVYLMFGLALMALLAIPVRGALRNAGGTIIDLVLLALLWWITTGALERGLFSVTILLLSTVPKGLGTWLEEPLQQAHYGMLPFLALAAYRMRWSPPPMADIAPRPPNPWRPGRSALIGASIAVVTLLWIMLPTDSLLNALYVLPVILGSFLLLALVPTLVVYAFLIASIFRFRARRDAIGTIALAVASLPFVAWGLHFGQVHYARWQERREVAGIPKVALPAKSGGIVVEADDGELASCAMERVLSADRDVGDVLGHSAAAAPYYRYTLTTLLNGQPVDAAPIEHILIRLPRQPGFLQMRHQVVDPAMPPAEIYTVDAGGARLAAATYTAKNLAPIFPPLLTISGWYDHEGRIRDAACKHLRSFIDRELLDKLPRQRM